MDKYRQREVLEIIKAAFIVGVLTFLIIALFGAVFGGCASIPDTVTLQNAQSPIYKYDIQGTINGIPFDGVGVVPYAPTYDMKIVSKVDVDALTITSCHRDLLFENAIELGWFDNGRGYNYKFNPDPKENNGECLVKFGAYNKGKEGQNAWGIVDFETPEATLPATNLCNGDVKQTNGVSICQSKAGLVQGLIFPVPVKAASKNPICAPTTKDNASWEYVIQPGECVIAFKEMAPSGRIHRHSSVGYTTIQLRGQ